MSSEDKQLLYLIMPNTACCHCGWSNDNTDVVGQAKALAVHVTDEHWEDRWRYLESIRLLRDQFVEMLMKQHNGC